MRRWIQGQVPGENWGSALPFLLERFLQHSALGRHRDRESRCEGREQYRGQKVVLNSPPGSLRTWLPETVDTGDLRRPSAAGSG